MPDSDEESGSSKGSNEESKQSKSKSQPTTKEPVHDDTEVVPLPECPDGLEPLLTIKQILVKQHMEILEAMTGYEQANQYDVMGPQGQLFWAQEESSWCCTKCCGSKRAFAINCADAVQNAVFYIRRPYKCCTHRVPLCCLFCGCLQDEVYVETPEHLLLGSVRQNCSFCRPSFCLRDEAGEPRMNIVGPFCQFKTCCGRDIDFKIVSVENGEEVGKVNKKYSGLVQEALTDADNFMLNFPKDLDPKLKAVLIGAVFLLDFMFFEDNDTKGKLNPLNAVTG